MELSVREIISDKELFDTMIFTDFDERTHREVIKHTLLKCACGYVVGKSAVDVSRELGLVHETKWELTKKGKEYLYAAYTYQ